MHKQIISLLISKYNGLKVDGRAFLNVNGYACTVYSANDTLSVSLELPLLAKNSPLICDICSHVDHACEYNYPSLNVAIDTTENEASCDYVISVLENITKLLCENSVQPNICIKCHETTDEYYNVNGYYCPIHKDCANKILSAASASNANLTSNKKARFKGIIVGASFAFFGSLSYILFGILGIMPSFGGILMGIFAALGYCLFNKKITKANKAVFAVIFLLFSIFSNFATDYVYAAIINKPLDFIATYTEPLNLFSTAFDVLSGAIIALFSMTFVTDYDRNSNSVVIKKINANTRSSVQNEDQSPK